MDWDDQAIPDVPDRSGLETCVHYWRDPPYALAPGDTNPFHLRYAAVDKAMIEWRNRVHEYLARRVRPRDRVVLLQAAASDRAAYYPVLFVNDNQIVGLRNGSPRPVYSSTLADWLSRRRTEVNDFHSLYYETGPSSCYIVTIANGSDIRKFSYVGSSLVSSVPKTPDAEERFILDIIDLELQNEGRVPP